MLILQLDSFISDCCLRPASRLIYFLIVWNPNFPASLVLLSSAIFIQVFNVTELARPKTSESQECLVLNGSLLTDAFYLFFSWKHRWHALSRTTAPNVLLHLTKSALFPRTSSWQPYQRSQQIKSRLKQQYLFFFSSRVTNFFFLSSLCSIMLFRNMCFQQVWSQLGGLDVPRVFIGRQWNEWGENECYYCKRVVKLLMMDVSLQPYSEKKQRQADSYRC